MTQSQDPGPVGTRRSDFLLSVCLVSEGDLASEFTHLEALGATLNEKFQYTEILYIVSESRRAALRDFADTISTIQNLRIIVVTEAVGFYKRRAIGASESLGEVTILTAFNELDIDLPALAMISFEAEGVVICTRDGGRGAAFSPVHWGLKAVSTHDVSPRYLRTIAVPRERLNAILTQRGAVLDLRFPPKHAAIAYQQLPIAPAIHPRTTTLGARYQLATELISNSASRFLRAYAGLSVFVIFASIIYAIYAVSAYFIIDVREGWLSTSIVQSGSVFFIACGMVVLSLGLAEFMERAGRDGQHLITDEITNLTFFRDTKALNVVDDEADQ